MDLGFTEYFTANTFFFITVNCLPHNQDHLQTTSISYTQVDILHHRNRVSPKPDGYKYFLQKIHPRKRGKKGGFSTLQNNMDDLRANVRFLDEYREACLLVFTETWLHNGIPDSAMDLDNYQIVRGDRTTASGKSRGEGVCMYMCT